MKGKHVITDILEYRMDARSYKEAVYLYWGELIYSKGKPRRKAIQEANEKMWTLVCTGQLQWCLLRALLPLHGTCPVTLSLLFNLPSSSI
jgi:hypothetical protein